MRQSSTASGYPSTSAISLASPDRLAQAHVQGRTLCYLPRLPSLGSTVLVAAAYAQPCMYARPCQVRPAQVAQSAQDGAVLACAATQQALHALAAISAAAGQGIDQL